MVKILHPIAHELGLLKEKVEDLEKKLVQCEIELSTVKTENTRLKLDLRHHKPSKRLPK